MTWTEVEEYLKVSQGIILPIGSTEQHGQTGLIGTDTICAEGIARGVGEMTNTVVAPTINVGMALHQAAFPGAIALRPNTLIELIQDYLTSLARAGFTKFFFVNGYGGNVATLRAAFAESYSYLTDLHIPNAEKVECRIANWFTCNSVYKLAKELYGNLEGYQATPGEVAVTQYFYPEIISKIPVMAEVGLPCPVYSTTRFRDRYAHRGRGYDPALATPEDGKLFYDLAVQELSEVYLEFIHQA